MGIRMISSLSGHEDIRDGGSFLSFKSLSRELISSLTCRSFSAGGQFMTSLSR